MQRLIAAIVCVLLGSQTFILAIDLSGSEAAVDYSGAISLANSSLDIGSALSGSHFLTYTMNAGGNDEDGFTLTFASDYVLSHNGDSGGVTVTHSTTANGHNQPFQLSVGNLIDSVDSTIATSLNTSQFGTATDSLSTDSTTITFNEPQRAVRATDLVKVGLHTSANADLISGTYVAEITVTIATL